MTRIMADACNPAHIPDAVDVVAGYVAGNCVWPPEAWARFAGKPHVRITTDAMWHDADVLDVERGAANVDQVVGWVNARRAAGFDPSVYMSEAQWDAVRAAVLRAGIAEPHYWVAAWNQQQSLQPGATAHQYDHDIAPGYDVSVVADYWPGIDPAPTPAEDDYVSIRYFTYNGVLYRAFVKINGDAYAQRLDVASASWAEENGDKPWAVGLRPFASIDVIEGPAPIGLRIVTQDAQGNPYETGGPSNNWSSNVEP